MPLDNKKGCRLKNNNDSGYQSSHNNRPLCWKISSVTEGRSRPAVNEINIQGDEGGLPEPKYKSGCLIELLFARPNTPKAAKLSVFATENHSFSSDHDVTSHRLADLEVQPFFFLFCLLFSEINNLHTSQQGSVHNLDG